MIDLKARFSTAMQGVAGEEQTAIVMSSCNDGSNFGFGLIGEPLIMACMFEYVLYHYKRGDGNNAIDKNAIDKMASAIIVALHAVYSIEELRDKFNVLDKSKAIDIAKLFADVSKKKGGQQ